jgi:uncharacterized repeat protein (TIGR03803 family)
MAASRTDYISRTAHSTGQQARVVDTAVSAARAAGRCSKSTPRPARRRS